MRTFCDVCYSKANKSLSRQGSRRSPLERVAKVLSLSENGHAVPFSPQDFGSLCEFSSHPQHRGHCWPEHALRLTVTREDRGGTFRGKGWKVCRNHYKGHMDNNRAGYCRREVGRAGVLGWGGGKRQKTVLEQQ